MKSYRRQCKICKAKFETVYIRQWLCGKDSCLKAYQKKYRAGKKSLYLAGKKYYYYKKKKKHKGSKVLEKYYDLKERVCLGVLCRGEKTFMSKGKFNRVCDACKVSIELYCIDR